MKDTQNTQNTQLSSWNEYAQYVLIMLKTYGDLIKELQDKDTASKICLGKKVEQVDFEKFLREDYSVFKANIQAKATMWGTIAGGIITLLGILIQKFV